MTLYSELISMMPNKRSQYLLFTIFGLAGVVTIAAAAALLQQHTSPSDAKDEAGDLSHTAPEHQSSTTQNSDVVPVRVFRLGTVSRPRVITISNRHSESIASNMSVPSNLGQDP